MREEEAPVDKGLRAELALKERNSAIKGRGWRGGGTIQGDKVIGQSLKEAQKRFIQLIAAVHEHKRCYGGSQLFRLFSGSSMMSHFVML